MCRAALAFLVAALMPGAGLHAQPVGASPARAPDDRFKTDLLLVVAHPDDDVLAGTYLARLVVDEGKRVAVVFATSGDSGGNQVGPERAASLGLIRQIEARRDLATLGITNVWFLSGHDTAGQDPIRSLANWGHGRVLAEAVRLVRLTRPEVILTWLPMQVAGENHGDHQASAVVAAEAFDEAGDPTAFPEQIAPPTQQFESLFEGLQPWQPKKLYFMSDAMDTRFMDGHGPSYSVTAVSRKGMKYWESAYEQLRQHLTQYRAELERLAAADSATRERMLIEAPPGDALIDPLRFIRGKSLVGGTATGDVFEGIAAAPVGFAPAPGYRNDASVGLRIGLGGPWQFYRRFWPAHGIAELSAIDLHEMGPVTGGTVIHVPLVIANTSATPQQVTVTSRLPEGWQEQPRPAFVAVPANGDVQFGSSLVGPAPPTGGIVEAVYEIGGGAAHAAPLKVRIVLRPPATQ